MLIRMDHPNARYSTSKQKQQLKLLILVLQSIKSMGNVTDGQLSIFMIFLKKSLFSFRSKILTCNDLSPFEIAMLAVMYLWTQMTM